MHATQISDPIRPRKLGLLAGTFEDGSVSIYAVPEPLDVTPPNHDISRGPVFGMYHPIPRNSTIFTITFVCSKTYRADFATRA